MKFFIRNTVKSLVDAMVKRVAAGKPDLGYFEKISVLPSQSGYHYAAFRNLEKLPESIQKQFTAIFQENGFLPERVIHLYQQVFISHEGVIFKNFQVAPSSLIFAGRRMDYHNSFFLKQWLENRVKNAPGVVAIVYNSNSYNNYYHWLIEACSKLVVLSNYCDNCAVLVPAPVPEYVTATTKLLGFSRLVPITKQEVIKVAHAIEVVQTSAIGNEYTNDYATHQDPLLLQQVREKLLSKLAVHAERPDKLLFISRAKQKTRRLQNEAELLEILEPAGFEVIFLEGRTFEEQARLLHEARVVIGVHGANLTNSLFMQPNQVLVELIDKDYFNPVYYRLASYSGLRYFRIGCEAASKKAGPEKSDIIVNTEEVVAVLAQIFS